MANYMALAFAVLRGHLLVGVLVGDLLVAAVLTKHFRCCTLVKTKGSDMGKPTPERHQHGPKDHGHATRVMFVVSSHGSPRVESTKATTNSSSHWKA